MHRSTQVIQNTDGSFEFVFDPGSTGLPLSGMPFTDDLLILTGQIALYWGSFEDSLDRLLAALASKNRTVLDRNWLQHSFGQRKGYLKDEMKLCFADAPQILAFLEKLLEDADMTQGKRNLLLHGILTAEITFGDPPAGGHITILAKARRKKGLQSAEFNAASLSELSTSLSHLLGRIHGFFSARIADPPLSLRETQILQAFVMNSRLHLPT